MVPHEGRLAALRLLLKIDELTNLRVRLAKTIAAGPDDELELSDFTECDFDGYAEKVNPVFDAPAINGTEDGESLSELLTWTAGAGLAAPQTIVGVYMVYDFDVATDRLLWFARVSPTVTLANPAEVFERKIKFLSNDIGI